MRLIPLIALAACSTSTPRQRYIQALNHRLEGNAEAYYDEMIALAHEEPESRAGRRARATLGGSSLTTATAVVGVLAAVSIPNFLKFQSRARQSEAKTNLKAIFTALKAYEAEYDRFCRTFEECNFEPEVGSRYVYFLSPQEAVGGDAAQDRELLLMRAESTLSAMGIKPMVAKKKFLAVAIGDPDEDGTLDVWSIDEQNNLVNLLNDME